MSGTRGRLRWNGADVRDPCIYCATPSQTWEHVKPDGHRKRGEPALIGRACYSCNHMKGPRPLLLFLALRASAIRPLRRGDRLTTTENKMRSQWATISAR